mmetsp:Transcript_6041/g.10038  ORF Transcript_6041/g.10038 Transcript_6041/m.10038 type:complete len:590 (+) Transcript_6041:115-1884(+)
MTDTCLDAACVGCHKDSKNLWLREVPEQLPLAGSLNIRILKVPNLSFRESCLGSSHYLVFQLGDQRIRTNTFDSVKNIRNEVFHLELDGKSHFLKISAHTWTWVPCMPNLLNGNMEIPIHKALEDQGIETQLYYKHRFHKLLAGSLRMQMWIDNETDANNTELIQGKLREHPQHPLEAWHRGAYDAIFQGWLAGRVRWTNDFWFDMMIHSLNDHLLLGIFFAHHWSPLTHRSRFLVYIVSMIMNVFVLGIGYRFIETCSTPTCNTNDILHCLIFNPEDNNFFECNSNYNGTLWCNSDVQDQCATITTNQEYETIALGAFTAFFITKFLIFFGECRCAKWSCIEKAGCRRGLEESGRFMMMVGVLISLLLLAMGLVFTVNSQKNTGTPTAEQWFWNYIVQLFQASLYDFVFGIFVYFGKLCISTYEPLKFYEDDEYFELNPKLGHIEIKSSGKSPSTRKDVTKPAEDQQIGDSDVKDIELAEKKKNPTPPPPIDFTQSRLNNMINRLGGDELDNVAAKPEIKKFKTDSKETKKMRVKVPANAKAGGLLKVKTPEKLSILVRLPMNVVPGETEMVIDYAVHQKSSTTERKE